MKEDENNDGEQGTLGRREKVGDFAPTLMQFTDDVFFGQVWPHRELSAKARSLVTVASLVTSGSTEQLAFHLSRARTAGLPNRS